MAKLKNFSPSLPAMFFLTFYLLTLWSSEVGGNRKKFTAKFRQTVSQAEAGFSGRDKINYDKSGSRGSESFDGERGFGTNSVPAGWTESESETSRSSGKVKSRNNFDETRRPSTSQRRRNENNIDAAENNRDLQTQFTDMFDWNLDLSTDSRFTSCTVPDIEDVSRSCPKRQLYFGMNPDHRRAVGIVKRILMGTNNSQETVCLAGAIRDLAGMNPNVWIRGLLGACASNQNLFNLRMPPLVQVMPNIFINSEAIQQAKRQIPFARQNRTCVVIDGKVGRDNGIENRLWYWREDILVNAFHLSWHLTYPFTGVTTRADRRGELFYFTHHSHLARYHAERLSNGLRKVVPLDIDVGVAIPEAYNSHLDDTNSALQWTPRRPNAILQDTTFTAIEGVPPNISISDRVLHVRRVERSIFNGDLLLPDGQRTSLNSPAAIDALGDVVEASDFSVNGDYYGRFGFHNEGHVLISLVEDPQNRSSIPPGVMVETATAMRDPVFYTYHASMDAVFERHKEMLTPYQPDRGELPLRWPGVEIGHILVESDDGEYYNSLKTFFIQRTFDLSRGLDFNRSGVDGPIQACVNQLDHVGFEYEISVYRSNFVSSNRGTVRVFLAPRFDETGRRYSIVEQRKLFFMLDLFTVNLQVGQNLITRKSTQSTLTINTPAGLREAQFTKKKRQPYCGCGWPHNLLLPKGTERGMIFDLFVMLTDGNIDIVPLKSKKRNQDTCIPAPIYCGRLNDTYPDLRPMGYPFDRVPYNYRSKSGGKNRFGSTLENFVYGVPNMATIQIRITHVKNQPEIREKVRTKTKGQSGDESSSTRSSSESEYSNESDNFSNAQPSANRRSQAQDDDEYFDEDENYFYDNYSS